VREIAVEIVRADGSRLPALINSVLRTDGSGRPQFIRTTVFDATDRRRYEQELRRARRREQDIAQQLQRSMLPAALPTADWVELAVVYRPAVRGLEVGGDWYDAFWLDDGAALGLVVGDVVGRGIEAAATMGQLRSAVRALASTGMAPARVLDALDRYVSRLGVGEMTTLVYAQLALDSGLLRYACAGHPPPMVVAPGQPPQLLWEGRSLPLDAHAGAPPAREEATHPLGPGATVLLYTDGLVERRSRPPDEGMDALLAAVAAHRGDQLSAFPAAVAQALHDPGHADDVCLLAARVG
jgi:serine phosphatase RsbU (regulator of sigma subunit)